VSVPVPRLREPGDVTDLVRRFHDAHRRRYGHMAEAEAVEIVNFQVTAIGLIPKPVMKTFSKTDAPAAPLESRPVYFNADEARDTPVFHRSVLQPGTAIAGPAVIEEKTSTTVLYPGQRAVVDGYLNIEVEI
jgi:N-methylhydantoinase A